MVAATATATEMQNNFGRYLNLVLNEPASFLYGAGNGNRTHLLSLEG